MVVYASSPEKPEYVVAPSPQSQQAGTKPLDTLPAQWWNWFLQEATERFNGDANLIGNMVSEIENLLALCNITPDPDSVTQLRDMFDNQYRDLIMGDVEPRLKEVEDNIQQNIVPQIDAVKSEIQNEIDPKIQAINEKIPAQASATNQLADKAFVNSTVATNTANFRGTFPNWESVPTEVNGYNSDYTGNKTPTQNDYMVVVDARDYTGPQEETPQEKIPITFETDGDIFAPYTTYGGINIPANSDVFLFGPEGKTFRYYIDKVSSSSDLKEVTLNGANKSVAISIKDTTKGHFLVLMIKPSNFDISNDKVYYALGIMYKGTWRFKYSGDWAINGRDGWSPEYQISSAPLTAAQLAALNSGATAERLSKLAPDGTYTGGGITYNGTKYNNLKVVSSNGLVTFNFE